MALVIFALVFVEFVSYVICYNENYIGEEKGSNYLLYDFPLLNGIQWFVVSSYFLSKIFRFKLCIYTIIVTVIYFIIQTFNLLALIFKFGTENYTAFIYPLFLFSIMGLTLIKLIRWVSFKRS